MTGKRTDSNHAEIKQALRRVGALVYDLTQARNHGVHCDLLVLRHGSVFFVEVKSDARAEFTQDEYRFALELESAGRKLWRVETVEDAMQMLGVF